MPLRRFVQIIFRYKWGECVLRKLAAWLAVLLAVCACAGAEAPVLVDRINTPQEYADFTFVDDVSVTSAHLGFNAVADFVNGTDDNVIGDFHCDPILNLAIERLNLVLASRKRPSTIMGFDDAHKVALCL